MLSFIVYLVGMQKLQMKFEVKSFVSTWVIEMNIPDGFLNYAFLIDRFSSIRFFSLKKIFGFRFLTRMSTYFLGA